MSAAWPDGPARPRLPRGEVHVWRAGLDGRGWPDAAQLPAAERERAARMLVPSQRWVASRWALRGILGRYLAADPATIALRSGEHGKPELADAGAGLAFNLSHSHGLALIAVTGGRQVGVDVEWIDGDRDVVALADRGLDPEAATAVRAAPAGSERVAAFYDAWVRHEARVKCLGGGLGNPPPSEPVALVRLDPGPDYAAALAAAGGERPRPRCWSVNPAGAG